MPRGAAAAGGSRAPGGSRRALRGGHVFTDDRAPVEWLIDASIVSVRRGGEPDERRRRRAAARGAGASPRSSCSSRASRRSGAEIAAARLVAPAFGASTVVWANTIAIVLVALAGRLLASAAGFADRHPHARGLALAALLGAALVALIPLVAIPLLGVDRGLARRVRRARCSRSSCSSRRPCSCSARCRRGRSGCACSSVAGAGDITGRLYALSTAGGLVGNFAAALALIPLVGTRWTFLHLRGAAGRGVRPGGMVLQACLNGDRESGVPRSPEELARGGAGVRRGGRGVAARAPARPGRARDARPGAHRRRGRARCAPPRRGSRSRSRPGSGSRPATSTRGCGPIAEWTERPDLVSLNLSEDGWRELADVLAGRGIGIEAGVWTARDAELPRAACVASGAGSAARATTRRAPILVEPRSENADEAVAVADEIDAVLDAAAIPTARLHHGVGPATWAVLDAAVPRGREIRIGLEDVLTLPDGRRAPDNAALVVEAVAALRLTRRAIAADAVVAVVQEDPRVVA